MKLLAGILLLALVTQAYSQLQCYVCEDCDELDTDNETPATCVVPPVTPSPEDTTNIDSTDSEDTSTPDTSLPDDTSDGSSINPPADSSTEPTSDSSSEPTSDSSTDVSIVPELLGNPLKSFNSLNDPRVIPLVFRRRRQAPEFRCFKVQVSLDDRVRVNRGCIQFNTNDATTCTSIYGTAPMECELCYENECNSSSLLVVTSLVALVVSLLITTRLL